MNSQQIFDEIVTHIRTQGQPAYNSDTRQCKYRYTLFDSDGNPSGVLKCAVGAIIPDKNYDHKIEGEHAFKVCQLKAVPYKYRNSKKKIDMLSDLQNCHDRSASHPEYFLRDFERRVQFCAENFNLVYTPPQQQTKG